MSIVTTLATTPSAVLTTPAAPAVQAMAHFAAKLAFETDCSDVFSALANGADDFILLDVRSEAAFLQHHAQGAQNLPHRDISAARMALFPGGKTFVVYCAGPHCNGADQAAYKIAKLGLPVKLMIGGITGWADEGLPFAQGENVATPEVAAPEAADPETLKAAGQAISCGC
jgi:rhodanese-related sulfurtransferase